MYTTFYRLKYTKMVGKSGKSKMQIKVRDVKIKQTTQSHGRNPKRGTLTITYDFMVNSSKPGRSDIIKTARRNSK